MPTSTTRIPTTRPRGMSLAGLAIALVMALAVSPARAGDAGDEHAAEADSWRLGDTRAAFQPSQPDEPSNGGESPEADQQTHAHAHARATLGRQLDDLPKPYGSPGTDWLRVGFAYADNLTTASEFNAHVEWSSFLVEDFELGVEVGFWYHDQPGDDALSINPELVLRWHFVNEDIWTIYLEGGLGVLVSTDLVPDEGTGFNFTPRAGIGFTRLIDPESRCRLEGGVRWHHISNARINGDVRNPSRDSILFFANLVIPL